MLTLLRFKSILLITMLFCQISSTGQNSCATGAPPEEWETAFRELVKKQAETMLAGKSQGIHRVIPVIVHVLHNGENIGTYPNIDSNQIKTQIDVLNNDFAGTGAGVAGVPSGFAHLVSNTGIQFCRAAIDYTGAGMIEHGANRINVNSYGWQNPGTPTLDIQSYLENTIITQTIWDPTKYINIWVSDRPASSTLLSFGTYPPQSNLIGIFSKVGTMSYDGMWIYARAFGTVADATAPTDKGRTTTHQMGHYFGVRHIWGDGNCLPDYANDTPPQKSPSTGCPVYPTPADECGVNTAPYGRMFMNFMDESLDLCKYMFTPDQNIRMQTALSQSPLRLGLGTHGLCSSSWLPPSASPAVASFTIKGVPCLNNPFLLINNSTGWPQPTYLWNVQPSANLLPNNTSSHPMLQITNPGSYVVSLVATNSLSSSSYSMLVTTHFTCSPEALCLDSLRMIKNTDSLGLYRAPVNGAVQSCNTASTTGWLTGTSCYQDKEIAQYFPATTYSSINYPQVNSLIVFFDSASVVGSKGMLNFRIYGGGPGSGPSGALGTVKQVSVGTINSTPDTLTVSYIGKPGVPIAGRRIITYKVDFDKPILISSPAPGFFAAMELPHLQPLDSVAIISDKKTNLSPDSSAWFRNFFGTWRTFRQNRGSNIHLAIIPQITCSQLTGIDEVQNLRQDNITVMPNPGSGEFMLVFSLEQQQQNVKVRVINAVGQEIARNELHNVGTHVATLTLNEQAPGVYFAEISNGTEKVVKKIVLTR